MTTTTILRSEFEYALKIMKTDKAPGPDNINTELLQYAGTKTKEELFKLIHDVYYTGTVPKDFYKSTLVLLPKKAGADQCSNFRTLSLISHASKLLTIIISKRVGNRIEEQLDYDQYGFRKNKGTREAILSLRVMLEKQIDRQKKTFMAFVDLEKAFDNVNWKVLFNIMNNVGIDIKDRNILYAIHKKQEAEIKINSTTRTANIQRGVRQGCPLSPSLFNAYVEQAIRDIKQKLEEEKIGVIIGGILISTIRFADDIVLLDTSEKDL